MSELQVLNSRGMLRPLASFTKEEMDGLTPEQRSNFDGLRSVLADAEAAEAALAIAVKAVEESVVKRNAALSEKQKHAISFHQLWRESTGKPPLPPVRRTED
jgi:hypothetical protein